MHHPQLKSIKQNRHYRRVSGNSIVQCRIVGKRWRLHFLALTRSCSHDDVQLTRGVGSCTVQYVTYHRAPPGTPPVNFCQRCTCVLCDPHTPINQPQAGRAKTWLSRIPFWGCCPSLHVKYFAKKYSKIEQKWDCKTINACILLLYNRSSHIFSLPKHRRNDVWFIGIFELAKQHVSHTKTRAVLFVILVDGFPSFRSRSFFILA